MLKVLILLFMVFGAMAVMASAGQFFPVTHIPTIQVSGQASVTTEPDRASLNMSVSEIKPSVSEAKALVDQKVLQIQQMLEQLGIDRKQINTSQLGVYRVMQDRKPQPAQGDAQRQYAYKVSRQVDVTIEDIAQLDQILDQSINLGTNRIWNINLYSSREDDLKLEALKLAAAKAKSTAQALADEYRRKLVGVYMAEHEFGRAAGPVYRSAAALEAGSGRPEFSRGTIEISSHVNAVYQIEATATP
jgi:uncharacterized protein YggE